MVYHFLHSIFLEKQLSTVLHSEGVLKILLMQDIFMHGLYFFFKLYSAKSLNLVQIVLILTNGKIM